MRIKQILLLNIKKKREYDVLFYILKKHMTLKVTEDIDNIVVLLIKMEGLLVIKSKLGIENQM